MIFHIISDIHVIQITKLVMGLAHQKQFNVTVEHGKLFQLAYLPEKTENMTHGVIGTHVPQLVEEGHKRGQEVARMGQMEVLFVLVPKASLKKNNLAMISYVQTVRTKKGDFISLHIVEIS